MSQVNVCNVICKGEKAPFLSPIEFDIYFESLINLKHSKNIFLFPHRVKLNFVLIVLTWKIIYIGVASDPTSDQVLEEASMEDLKAGAMQCTLTVRFRI
jgi:hypothetical protein